jgi:hypothetical protein
MRKYRRPEALPMYLWGGSEAGFVESMIQEYNDSQDRYSVKGRSVPDYQEIISDACQKAMIMEIGIGETLAEADFKARSLY